MKAKDHLKTLIFAGLLLLVSVPYGNGFLLALALPFLLVAVLYHGIRMLRRPAERPLRRIRLLIWSLAIGLAGIVQAYWSVASRHEAELAASTLVAHRAQTGAYPASLLDAGLDEQRLRTQWSIRYLVRDGKPALAYPAPLMPLTQYEYDFEAKQWRTNAS